MAEAVYNAAGLGLPIVMTLGNRAIGAPINIWNDHSDAMSMRDAGWMQLFAETNQESVDLHIQAFRLAEELSMPVMVCVDGFILTHAVERVDMPTQAEVDAYLPPYEPVQVLDPQGSDLHRRHGGTGRLHRSALPAALQADSGAAADPRTRRRIQDDSSAATAGGLLRTYRAEDAEMLVVAMGSVNGTIKDAIDEMRADGFSIGAGDHRVVPPVSDRGAAQAAGRRASMSWWSKRASPSAWAANSPTMSISPCAMSPAAPQVHSVIAGLGGRPITRASLQRVFRRAMAQPWEGVHFLDLNEEIVGKELDHVRKCAAPGRPPRTCCAGSSQAAQAAAAE